MLCIYVVMSIIEATAKLATHKECFFIPYLFKTKNYALKKAASTLFDIVVGCFVVVRK